MVAIAKFSGEEMAKLVAGWVQEAVEQFDRVVLVGQGELRFIVEKGSPFPVFVFSDPTHPKHQPILIRITGSILVIECKPLRWTLDLLQNPERDIAHLSFSVNDFLTVLQVIYNRWNDQIIQ